MLSLERNEPFDATRMSLSKERTNNISLYTYLYYSIIKHLTKEKYNLESKEYRFFDEKEKKYERTQKYIFTKVN